MQEADSTPEGGPDRKVTIYDVAAAAGVSAATVSRALNRPDRVSFRTAEKVRAAAKQLGYRRELATRSNAGRERTGNLGIVVADITNPFFLEIIRGAEHAARVGEFQVLVADVDEMRGRSHSAAEAFIPHVDALLLASARLSNNEITKIARRLPTVCVNRPVPGLPSVLVDNYEGAIKAASHLEELGARSITYIGGPDGSWTDATRLRGLLNTVGNAETSGNVVTFTRSATLPLEQVRRLARVSVHPMHADAPTIRRRAAGLRALAQGPHGRGGVLQQPGGHRIHAAGPPRRMAGARGRRRGRLRQHGADHDRAALADHGGRAAAFDRARGGGQRDGAGARRARADEPAARAADPADRAGVDAARAWCCGWARRNGAGARSPPRMRGRPHPGRRRHRSRGLTPANAGKTPSISSRMDAHGAHPRECGEDGRPGGAPSVGRWLTPANAGKTDAYHERMRFEGAHPRECGEDLKETVKQQRAAGSPPRMRGRPVGG